MIKVIMTQCDGCKEIIEEEETSTCISSDVTVTKFYPYNPAHMDNAFFCKRCLNKYGFCQTCSEHIPENIQEKISQS